MADNQKKCFVVMGFGTKTDLATGRRINLDKSYHALIKPVVESKGLICVRADEIRHSGTIDVPMYQQLLTADVVVADLSTANPNAFYELGLRHALRPRTTIVISEEQLCYPFDLNHVLINKYTHLGENIDYFEVLRFQKLLGETLDEVLKKEDPDSPVYTFLDGLIPPSLQKKAERMAQQVGEALKESGAAKNNEVEDNPTLSIIVHQAEEALKARNFSVAKSLFYSAFHLSNCANDKKLASNYSYLFHRLAYTTYKAKEPDELTALAKAIDILDDLDLQHTNDSETVSLAGRIEKRLYFNNQGEVHLANAIQYFERAYFLLHNRYHGINLAFLINNRVDTNLYTSEQEKIADLILANRIRREVLQMCERDWNKLKLDNTVERKEILNKDDELAEGQREMDKELKFWILVNKAEAHFGLGEIDQYKEARRQASVAEHREPMMTAFDEQVKKLRVLMKKYGHLLKVEWNNVEV